MDENERRIIDDLFGKLRQVEDQGGPRDAEAEALIRRHVGAQPAAPYYMAQAIVVQEQALGASQARIRELERQLAERPAGGGLLAGLFGGAGEQRAPDRGGAGREAAAPPPAATGGQIPLQHYRRGGAGGGFLAGAMQTAVGVAGGVLIGNALAGLFAPDEAAAAADGVPEEAAAAEEGAPEEAGDTGWGAADAAYDEPSFGDGGGSFLDDAEF